MLEINLSTRPFYNERAVHFVLGLLAVAAVVMAVGHARRLATLSARHTALSRQIDESTAAAARLDRESEALEHAAERPEVEAVAAAARQANDLIDRRTFSWTEFFNVIETTLPADVMLTSVRPQFDRGAAEVSMTVIAKGSTELGAFMDELEKTGAFADVLVRQEEVTDRGLHRAVLNGRYLGRADAGRSTPARAPSETARAGS